MASDDSAYYAFFEHAAGSKWLLALINARLAEILPTVQPLPDPETKCLLAEVGNYIVRCSVILSRVAEGLANGEHVRKYATASIEYMEQGSGFSDLGLLNYFDSKHKSLRQLASDVQIAADSAESLWQQSQNPPDSTKKLGKRASFIQSPDNIESLVQMGDEMHESMGHDSGATQFQHASFVPESTANTVDSPTSDDSVYETIQECLRALSSTARGKGEHVCPLGIRCSKGGVSEDGTVTHFERNSAFKAHLQKHERLHKCELPGCKNKKGFARIDQLRRHQEVVSHQPQSANAA